MRRTLRSSIAKTSLALLFALPAWATVPSFHAVGAVGEAGSGTTIDVGYPTVSADDILILQVESSTDSDTFTQPSGWSILDEQTYSGAMAVSVYWKRATGSESGTLTVTRSGSSGTYIGSMTSWTGCETSGTPFEIAGTYQSGTGNIYTTAITPTYDDSLILHVFTYEDNPTVGLTGHDTGDDWDANAFQHKTSLGSDAMHGIDYLAMAGSPTTEAQRYALASGAPQPYLSWTIAFFEPQGGGPAPRRRSNTSG